MSVPPVRAGAAGDARKTPMERMKELKALLEAQFVTQAEYDNMRAKILESLA